MNCAQALFLIAGLLIGIILGFAIARYRNGRTTKGLGAEVNAPGNPKALNLKGIQNVRSIEFKHDTEGRITGLRIEFHSRPAQQKERSARQDSRSPEPPKNLRVE